MDQDPDALKDLSELVKKEGIDVATALLDSAARTKGDKTGEYIKTLVEQGADISGRRRAGSLARSKTLSPLDVAIMKGNVEAVRALLEKGADTSGSQLINKSMSVHEAVDKLIQRINRQSWKSDRGFTFNKK